MASCRLGMWLEGRVPAFFWHCGFKVFRLGVQSECLQFLILNS